MNKNKFLEELTEELEIETQVSLDTNLKDLDEWDSMGAMILIGFVSDNFDITLTADDIKELTTFQSIIDRIGAENFS